MLKKTLLFFIVFTSLSCGRSLGQTFYGTTRHGGTTGGGTIFSVNGNGTNITTAYNFVIDANFGRNAEYSQLFLASNSLLYGTTFNGGTTDSGVLFEYNPTTSVYTKKFDFDNQLTKGSLPVGKLIQYTGLLYGITLAGGNAYEGIIYSFNPVSGAFEKLYDFGTATGSGSNPWGGLALGADNMMYGMTSKGGTNGKGTLYRFNPATKVVDFLFNFDGINGDSPLRELTLSTNNLFYGTTVNGGTSITATNIGVGVLFEFNPVTGVVTKKGDFDLSTAGGYPVNGLTRSSNGKFYGSCGSGGSSGEGTLFEFDPANSTTPLKKVFSFDRTNTGVGAFNTLARISNDKMYGASEVGGTGGGGVIFEFNPATGFVTLKYSMNGFDHGYAPKSGLALASNNKFYGIAAGGGYADNGTLFEWDPATNAFVREVDFKKSASGANPDGPIVQASNGKIVGLTNDGGTYGNGVIYEFDPLTAAYNMKFDFNDYTNKGINPWAGLAKGNNGKYYGSTLGGGTGNEGIIFEYDYATNTFAKKIDMVRSTHGAAIYTTFAIVGNVAYGAAKVGGANDLGSLFEYNYVTNAFTKYIDFDGANNGAYPVGSMIAASNGTIYGMTSNGGLHGAGEIFSYNTTTHQITRRVDLDETTGTNPEGGLIEISGKLYGVTQSGGTHGGGTLFELDTDVNGTGFTKKWDFSYDLAANPISTLTAGAGNKLYGTTTFSGDLGVGTVFEYDLTLSKFTVKSQFNGTNGAHPGFGALLATKIPPRVISLDPPSAAVGSTIAINGFNFGGNPSDNTVYFGAVKATVTSATSTQLQVVVPPGTSFQPVSVSVNSLIGYSKNPFVTTFPGGSTMTAASFEPKIDFATSNFPYKTIVADADVDGKPDVIVVNASANSFSVYPNTATTAKLSLFSLASKVDFTANGPIGIASGDLDGDGRLDIVVTNVGTSTVSVYRNFETGNGINLMRYGTHVDFAVTGSPVDVAIADIDLDGHPDIITANQGTPSISVLRSLITAPGALSLSSFAGKIDFTAPASPASIKIWDVDNDDKPDIIVGAANAVSIFRNNSIPGLFTAGSLNAKVDITTIPVNSFAVGDIDGDGLPDLAVSSAGTTMSLFRNISTPGSLTAGSFATKVDITVGATPNGSFADMDGDGKLDLVVASRANSTVSIHRNIGSSGIAAGTFGAGPIATLTTGPGPDVPLIADLDNDGKPDIIVANNGSASTNTMSIIHNTLLAPEPGGQANNIQYSNVSATGMTVNFTGAAGADGYIALMSVSQAPNIDPIDGISYPLNSVLGQVAGNDIKVAYLGSNTTFNVDGLAAQQSVFFSIYSYKGAASVINYLTANPAIGTRSTLAAEPTTQASDITFSAVTTTSMTVNFTNGNGAGRLLVVKAGGPVDGSPVDGNVYTSNVNLASAPLLTAGNFIVGISSPTTVTGLIGGTTYHFRVFEFNGTPGAQNYFTSTATGNPASKATVIPDGTPPVVTLTTIGATAPATQVNVSATVIDNESTVGNVTLYYRSTSVGGIPASKLMSKGTGNIYSASIEPAQVGDLGVEYKVRATSDGGTSDASYTSIVVSSAANSVTVPYDAFGSQQVNYRIVAVPLDLATKTVSNVFDELGTANKKLWRLLRWDGSVNRDLASSDPIDAGKGYWLIIKNSGAPITAGPGNTVPTTSDLNFSINLSPDWNQIGNPYPFNLLWTDVVAANPGLGTLRTYRSNNPGGGSYPWGDGTVLRAYEGGFINNTTGLSKLNFPVVKNTAAGRPQENPLISNPLTDDNWQLYIVAKHNDLENRISGIGMRKNASENSDPFDGYSMPRFFEHYLELNHSKKIGDDHLSMDIVPTSDEHTWQFDIETSEVDPLITLEWDNSKFGDNDRGLILWDESRQIGVDMRTENSYTFDRTVSHSFKVYFGRADKLAGKLEIRGLVLHSVSPNPAEGEVRVAFSVPDSQQVEIEAVDVLGRKVWNALGSFNKGYHEVLWNGETRANARGLYIIRLKSGDETGTARIYLK